MADADVSVVAELVAKVDGAVEGFNRVANSMQTALEEMRQQVNDAFDGIGDDMQNRAGEVSEAAGETAAESFGESFSAGIQAATAEAMFSFLDKVKEAVNEAAGYANRLGSLKIETGDSEQNLQKLQYAFASVGVSSDSAGVLFARFQRAISTAADQHNGRSVLERMGLDPKAMKAGDISDNLAMVADKISHLKDASEKASVAVALFGRAGYSILPALNEGGKALKQLEAQADGMGVLLPKEMLDRFDALHSKMDELEQTSEAFYARFAAPFVNALLAVDSGIQRFMASMKDMSDGSRLGVIFGALLVGLSATEKALEYFKNIPILKEFGEGLTKMLPVIQVLIVAAFVLAEAFQVNLGGIVQLAQNLGNMIVRVASMIGTAFNSIVVPALQRILYAFGPLIQMFTNASTALMNNKTLWAELSSTINGFASFLASSIGVGVTILQELISAIVSVVSFFMQYKDAVMIVAAVLGGIFFPEIAVVVGALFTLGPILKAVAGFLDGLSNAIKYVVAWFQQQLAILAPVGQALLGVLIPAIQFCVSEWNELVHVVQAVIQWLQTIWSALVRTASQLHLTSGNTGEFSKYLKELWESIDTVNKFIGGLLTGLSLLATAFANATRAAGEFLQWLGQVDPWLARIGDTAVATAGKIDKLAAALARAANAEFKAKAPPIPNFNFTPGKGGGGGGPKAEEGTGGDSSLGAEPGKKSKKGGGEAATEAITAIKNSLEPIKDAIAETVNWLDRLQLAYKLIGDINTPARLAAAEKNLTEQVKATNQERLQELTLSREAEAGSRRLQGLASRDKDPKTQREFHRASLEMHQESEAAANKALSLESSMIALKKQEQTITEDFYNKEEERAKTYANQLAIIAKINELYKQGKVSVDEELKAQKEKADILQAQAEYAQKMIDAKLNDQEQQVSFGKSTRDATPIGPDPSGTAAYAKEIADAEDDLTIATLKASAAQAALTAAQQKEAAAKGQGEAAENAARLATIDALNAEKAATNAETLARQQLLNKQQETDAATLKVRDGFRDLAQQAVGPLFNALQSIINGGNPLVTMFQALYQQTGSFKDIQAAFKEITQAVAEIFDALRPVIDFFLGILIGIVNVFIIMYNVVVELLDVFGLGIQKIKLLTTNLNNLNQAVPLLQITHDLPTANEYNSGKWGPLVAKQDETNNTLDAGFNQMATKMGEIAGTLIAIRMLMYVFAGQGLLGQNSSGGGIMGFFKGILGKFTGNKTSSKDPAQASDENTTATTTNTQGLTTSNQNQTQTQQVVTGNTQAVGANTQALQANTQAMQQESQQSEMGGSGDDNNLLQSFQGMSPTSDFSGFEGLGEGSDNPLGITGDSTTDYSTFKDLDTTTGQTNDTLQSTNTGLTNLGTAMTYLTSAMQLFGGLSKGGTFGETLGGLGGIVGGIFGGPLGSAIGQTAGEIIGSFFGPKHQGSQPDKNDPNFGNEIVGLTGQKFGTQGFGAGVMSDAVKSLTGGVGLLQYIETAIANGNSGLSAAQIAEFGSTGGGKINMGHNLENESVVGGDFSGNYQTLWNDAMTAAQQIAQNLQNGAQSMTNAANVNLASMFGNGVSTVNGGYSVNPGTSNTDNSTTTPTTTITIGSVAVHGTDSVTAKNTATMLVSEIQSQLGAATQRTQRNSQNAFGRDTYARG